MVPLLLLLLAAPASAHELTVFVAGEGPSLVVQADGRGARTEAIAGGRAAVVEVDRDEVVQVLGPDRRLLWTGRAPETAGAIGLRPGRGGALERVPLALDQGAPAARKASWRSFLTALIPVGVFVWGLRSGGAGPRFRWADWLTPLVFLLLSAAWSYPAILLSPERLPGRHFDIFPVIWLAERVPGGLPTDNWPLGGGLLRLDSWLLLPWALLPLSGVTVAALMAWLGPALSAWAAEVCARRAFGVPAPYSLLAGVAYGFSGIAASALLEGHVPHLVQPWLPLTLGAAWLAPQGGRRMALLAGLGAALSLLTTGYHGIDAVLIIAVLAVRTRVLLWAALPVAVAAIPIAFTLGGGGEAHALDIVERGSLSLWTLVSLGGGVDAHDHSVSAPLGIVLTVGLLLGRNRWLQGLALLAIVLAFGPTLRLVPWEAGLRLPWAALYEHGLGDVLRFPIRFMWVTALCGGVLAARATVDRHVGALPFLLLLGVAGPLTPLRARARAMPVVEVLREGPVLDLFPVAVGLGPSDIDMWARTQACAAQLSHGQPTLARCMGTGGGDVRERLAGQVLPALLAGRDVTWLGQVGVASVVLHRGFFRDHDASALADALTAQLGPPSDQGARMVWTVPGDVADADAALEALGRRGTLR